MRLKTRIAKLERKIPEEDGEPTILLFIRGRPRGEKQIKVTKEEREIAIKKALEIDPSPRTKTIFFQEYGTENESKSGKIDWDYELGLGVDGRRTVHKLIGERPKDWPF